MTGELTILNVGAGDTTLSFDKKKPEEVRRARAAITDMLKRGFAILVEVGTRKGKPIYQRAEGFDPKTDEYIIVGAPEEKAAQADTSNGRRRCGRRAPYKTRKRVAASGTRAIAVGRSAGG